MKVKLNIIKESELRRQIREVMAGIGMPATFTGGTKPPDAELFNTFETYTKEIQYLGYKIEDVLERRSARTLTVTLDPDEAIGGGRHGGVGEPDPDFKEFYAFMPDFLSRILPRIEDVYSELLMGASDGGTAPRGDPQRIRHMTEGFKKLANPAFFGVKPEGKQSFEANKDTAEKMITLGMEQLIPEVSFPALHQAWLDRQP